MVSLNARLNKLRDMMGRTKGKRLTHKVRRSRNRIVAEGIRLMAEDQRKYAAEYAAVRELVTYPMGRGFEM